MYSTLCASEKFTMNGTICRYSINSLQPKVFKGTF